MKRAKGYLQMDSGLFAKGTKSAKIANSLLTFVIR